MFHSQQQFIIMLMNNKQHKHKNKKPISIQKFENKYGIRQYDQQNYKNEGTNQGTNKLVKIAQKQKQKQKKCRFKGLNQVHKKLLKRGRNTYQDGSVYEGDVHNGVRHGFGIHQYSDGSYYRGQFQNDHRHGYGQYQNATTGDLYYGNYYQGKRHGPGKYLKNGEFQYNGNFQMGVMTGTAVLLIDGVLRYEGQFRQGKWGDKGTIFTKDKQIQWDNKDAYEVFKKLRIPQDLIIELLEKYIFKDGKNNKTKRVIE